MTHIGKNLEKVRVTIRAAAKKAGRNPDDVKLVAVTKTRSREEILALSGEGVDTIGENRVQELSEKIDYVQKSFEVHLIGHLQTNKVRKAVEMVDCIQSVDSLKLARAIDRICKETGKQMPVLIEVNTSEESQKWGVGPGEVNPLLEDIAQLKNLSIRGFMTMALFTQNEQKQRACFQKLSAVKKSAQTLGLPGVDLRHLSMGMSGDYAVAVEEGATMVRVGSALFESGEN